MSKKKAFADMSVEELRDEATKADIAGRSSMNKDELIGALEAGPEPVAAKGAEVKDAPLTLSAPAEVPCHQEFDVGWTAAEGVKDVIIAGLGKVTTSPVRIRGFEQGPLIVTASGTDKDGKEVTASATVQVVGKK